MSINADAKIKAILDDAGARAIVDEILPGFSTDPQIFICYGMGMRKLLGMPNVASKVSKEQAAQLCEALDAYGAAE